MKVAVVNLGRRGAGPVYGYCAAKAIAGRCETVAVISRQAENRLEWRKLPLAGVWEVDTYRSAAHFLYRSCTLWGMLPVQRALRKLRPDVVYVPMQSPLTPVMCALLRNVPRVVTEHDPVLHDGDNAPLRRLTRDAWLRRSARVIVLSRVLVPAVEAIGVPGERIDVVPHGSFQYYRDRTAPGAAGVRRGPTLLFFGRFEPYKGIDVLLDAFPEIWAAVPGATLLMAGAGDFTAYRQRTAAIPGVQVVNRWIPDEEVGTFFERADAVVLPYAQATQSGVAAIAAAFGVPVIASDVGGLSEQVGAQESGLLVPPLDAPALARACISVLTDPGLHARLSGGALRRAGQEMNWDRVADLLCRSFERAVES